MKIIKEFEDNIYFYKNFYLDYNDLTLENCHNHWWWGLGDDLRLYCQCDDFEDPDCWYDFKSDTSMKVDLEDMLRIVKKFQNVLDLEAFI